MNHDFRDNFAGDYKKLFKLCANFTTSTVRAEKNSSLLVSKTRNPVFQMKKCGKLGKDAKQVKAPVCICLAKPVDRYSREIRLLHNEGHSKPLNGVGNCSNLRNGRYLNSYQLVPLLFQFYKLLTPTTRLAMPSNEQQPLRHKSFETVSYNMDV